MRALIFANGDPVPSAVAQQWLQPDARVIAADGGTHNALAAGLMPHEVIGDLDSLTETLRADLEARGTRFHTFPARKDETDLELAIEHALACGAGEIVLLSALGGRWDQSLANILLLASSGLRSAPARIVDERQTMQVIRPGLPTRLEGQVGDTLSLLALGGDAQGVTLEGCEYPLHDAVLPFGKTLGISNVLAGQVARVSVRKGIVLAIHIYGLSAIRPQQGG